MESLKPRPDPRPAKRKTEPLPAVIHARSIKVTVVVDQESFPFKAVPAVGTPGAKTAQLPFVVRVEGGHALHVTLKGGTLQRFAQTFRDNPQGGAALLAGKLSEDGKAIVEAGITFQPKVAAPPPDAPGDN